MLDKRNLNVLTLWLCLACGAHAETISAKVVGVADGDTLTVLIDGRTQLKVRLLEIDAPENRQAFGNRSKQSLSDMCFGKQARVESSGIDRYGRTLGRVYCAGVDSNAEQVKRGMAWVYDRYVKDRSLYAVQESARGARVGLWADVNPIPPWEFRRASKKGN